MVIWYGVDIDPGIRLSARVCVCRVRACRASQFVQTLVCEINSESCRTLPIRALLVIFGQKSCMLYSSVESQVD